MKEVVTSIESLITRGYASIFIFFPASTITLLLIHFFSGQCLLSMELSDILVNNLSTIKTVGKTAIISIGVIVSIGCGMILNSLHKFLFDKLLRGNFNSLFSKVKFHTNLDKVLDNLRKHAINKLSNEKKILKINDDAIKQSDFFLYESIGGIVHTDTREYVNDARVIGYIALSFQIPLITELVFRMNTLNTIELNFFPFSILIVLSYIIGYENIKYIYKLRAIRIYTNYLMDEQLSKSEIILVNDIPNKTHENKGVNG